MGSANRGIFAKVLRRSGQKSKCILTGVAQQALHKNCLISNNLAGDERIFIRRVVAQHGFREREHGVRERFAKKTFFIREEWPFADSVCVCVDMCGSLLG